MKRLRGELKDDLHRTVQCPDCTQFALVMDGGLGRCHFCPRDWGGDTAEVYASEILNFSWHDVRKGADPIVVECPNCGLETLVLGALTADDPQRPVSFCFTCTETYGDELDACMKCNELFVPQEEETVCDRCWREAVSHD
jgi:hypothetical protein